MVSSFLVSHLTNKDVRWLGSEAFEEDTNRVNLTLFLALDRTTLSQDVQTRFPVQLAYAKFLSRIKGKIFEGVMYP